MIKRQKWTIYHLLHFYSPKLLGASPCCVGVKCRHAASPRELFPTLSIMSLVYCSITFPLQPHNFRLSFTTPSTLPARLISFNLMSWLQGRGVMAAVILLVAPTLSLSASCLYIFSLLSHTFTHSNLLQLLGTTHFKQGGKDERKLEEWEEKKTSKKRKKRKAKREQEQWLGCLICGRRSLNLRASEVR